MVSIMKRLKKKSITPLKEKGDNKNQFPIHNPYLKLGIAMEFKKIPVGIEKFRMVLDAGKFDYFKDIDAVKEFFNRDIEALMNSGEQVLLGFNDEDLNLDNFISGGINITVNPNIGNAIKNKIETIETEGLLSFTTFYNLNANVTPYLVWSHEYDILLGVGLLYSNGDSINYDTYFFWRKMVDIDKIFNNVGIGDKAKESKNNKAKKKKVNNMKTNGFSLEQFKRSVYIDKENDTEADIKRKFNEYIQNNIYDISDEIKMALIFTFVESEFYTNYYDRTLLSLIANNSKTISKLQFVKKTNFLNNYIEYSTFDITDKDKKCCIRIRCDKRADYEMDKLPKMDALEYLLENYNPIYICLPIPESLLKDRSEGNPFREKDKKEENN